MSASPPSMSTAPLLSECISITVLPARSIRDTSAVCGLLCACCAALCGGLMLWCLRCVLSFKMGFWVCGSGGLRDVHVLSCTRVVQIGVAIYAHLTARISACSGTIRILCRHSDLYSLCKHSQQSYPWRLQASGWGWSWGRDGGRRVPKPNKNAAVGTNNSFSLVTKPYLIENSIDLCGRKQESCLRRQNKRGWYSSTWYQGSLYVLPIILYVECARHILCERIPAWDLLRKRRFCITNASYCCWYNTNTQHAQG